MLGHDSPDFVDTRRPKTPLHSGYGGGKDLGVAKQCRIAVEAGCDKEESVRVGRCGGQKLWRGFGKEGDDKFVDECDARIVILLPSQCGEEVCHYLPMVVMKSEGEVGNRGLRVTVQEAKIPAQCS